MFIDRGECWCGECGGPAALGPIQRPFKFLIANQKRCSLTGFKSLKPPTSLLEDYGSPGSHVPFASCMLSRGNSKWSQWGKKKKKKRIAGLKCGLKTKEAKHWLNLKIDCERIGNPNVTTSQCVVQRSNCGRDRWCVYSTTMPLSSLLLLYQWIPKILGEMSPSSSSCHYSEGMCMTLCLIGW